MVASECLEKGQAIQDARVCLARAGYKGGNIVRDRLVRFHKCGLNWGYPFAASCGGIVIHLEADETVESWEAWGELDTL